MNDNIETQIIALYDEYIVSAGDEGAKVSEAKNAIRDDVRRLVVGADRDVDGETERLINAAIASSRGKRSRSLKKNLEYLLDGMTEEGAYVDPFLDMAFGVGDEHGLDKALRSWTAEDFGNVTMARYRVAADTTASAKEFDEVTQKVVSRMHIEGAATLGEVHWDRRSDDTLTTSSPS